MRFDQAALRELGDSLRDYGVLQPLVVRQVEPLEDGRNRYMLIAGERRYHAAQLAGLTRLPVLVREGEGMRLRVLQLIENLQREELPPVDEARAYRELMELEHLSIREVATLIKRSLGYVAERLHLVKSEDVASAVQEGRVTASAAAVVARERNAEARRALLERVEREKLQRKDVERLRRQLYPPKADQRTLREVAESMGATEAQIRAAADARREEPELTVAEALALAMAAESTLALGSDSTSLHAGRHAPVEAPATGLRDVSAQEAQDISPTDGPTASSLAALPVAEVPLLDIATMDIVLRILEWAREQGIDRLDLLYERIQEQRARHMGRDESVRTSNSSA